MKQVITFADFTRLDIRVGTIKKVEVPQGSEHVYRLTVDLGNPPAGGGRRTIFASLKKVYTPEELEGKQGVFLVNLEPKKVMGEESEGMLLAADCNGEPTILMPKNKVPVGSMVR